MLPNVITYSLIAASATGVVNAAPIQGPGPLPLNSPQTLAPTGSLVNSTTNPVVLDNQRRLLITTSGNESSNKFTIVGLNQNGFTTTEIIVGPSSSTAQSLLDYKTVISITPLATTAATVSVGTNGVGDTPWNIINTHDTPVNIEVSTILVTGAATWSVQYTDDDPNNLPAGVTAPQAFNHATIVNATATVDGSITSPIFANRLQITGGTGTIRFISLQAGISGP
jgi:hypothetical protein